MAAEETLYIVVDFEGDDASAACAPGATWSIEGIDTARPSIVLPDGVRYEATYKHSMGTSLIMAPDASGSNYQCLHKLNAMLVAVHADQGKGKQQGRKAAAPAEPAAAAAGNQAAQQAAGPAQPGANAQAPGVPAAQPGDSEMAGQ